MQTATSPPTDQSLQKSFHLSHRDKIELKKFSDPSENKNYATTQTDIDRQQTDRTIIRKLNADNGLQGRWTRTPAANSVYVAIAGEVINRRSVLLIIFVPNGQESASNPLLHIHANRYVQP